MIQKLIIYWFKYQAAKAVPSVLIDLYSSAESKVIIRSYWKRYLRLKPEVPDMPTLGSSLTVNLAAMSTAFYQELTERGVDAEITTQMFHEIAWTIYQKMGKFTWLLARIGNRSDYNRLLKATKLFRKFPFNSPAYHWENIETKANVVGFNCTKCPVAEYFETKGLSKFCTATWCALDYPLAEMWNAKLERIGSIAGGAKVCDFRWVIDSK